MFKAKDPSTYDDVLDEFIFG